MGLTMTEEEYARNAAQEFWAKWPTQALIIKEVKGGGGTMVAKFLTEAAYWWLEGKAFAHNREVTGVMKREFLKELILLKVQHKPSAQPQVLEGLTITCTSCRHINLVAETTDLKCVNCAVALPNNWE